MARSRLLLAAALLALVAGRAAEGASISSLQFLGEARLPNGLMFKDTEVGGLSALAWDGAGATYLALSDDGSERAPARLYRLTIDFKDGKLEDGDVKVTGLVTLRNTDNQPFAKLTVDPEGLAQAEGGFLFLSSEGRAQDGIPPFIREYAPNGLVRRELLLPGYYLPTPDGKRGVRNNLGFEALTLTSDGGFLFAGLENSLAQDEPQADFKVASPSRLLRFDASSGRITGEFLYWVDPVFAQPKPPTGRKLNGLVELLGLDRNSLLALERAWVEGVGHDIRLYHVGVRGATDIAGVAQLPQPPTNIKPLEKDLLLNLSALGIQLDNIEGMSFGPYLPDGRRTLILVSDNNFDSKQVTQFLAFAISDRSLGLAGVLGGNPGVGAWIWDLNGRVAKLSPGGEGFWLGEFRPPAPGTAERSLFVTLPAGVKVKVGDSVDVSGRLERQQGSEALTLKASAIGVISTEE